MNRRETESKNRILILGAGIAILLLIAAFTAAVLLYFRRFDSTLDSENRSHLAEITNQVASHLYTILEDTRTEVTLTANAVSSIDNLPETLDYLTESEKALDFAYLGYAGADGNLYTSHFKDPTDISQQEYFKAAMEGEVTSTDLVREIMEDKAVSGIHISAPVTGDGGEVTGAVVALLDIKRLQSVINVSCFDGSGFTYLMNGDGDFVLRTKSMDFNNFYTVLQNVEFAEGYSLEQLKQDITRQKEGMLLYSNLGTEQYAYYLPLGFNNWTVVNIVAKEAVTANTAALTRELAFLSVISVVVFIILLAIAAAAFANSQNQRHITQMKSVFLANMSHELRTPMNAVVGISELLLREDMSQQQQDYVRMIASSGKNLLTIINDILDFSKIESGKFTLVDEVYSLKSLITDITTLVVIRIGNKPIHFYVDVENSLPAQLTGDHTRIRQILVNLLGNAVKFTHQGTIILKIRSVKENEKIRLTFTVSDTGIGIKKSDMDRLFVNFNQVDTHHNHNLEGTGLGLAITKQLTELMDGWVRAESTYGVGSVFTAAVYQLPAGEACLFEDRLPDHIRVHLYEPDDALRRFYQTVVSSFAVSCQAHSSISDLLAQAPESSLSIIIAGQEALSSPEMAGFCEKRTCIPLLPQQEYGYLSSDAAQNAIYAPLFCIDFPRAVRQAAVSTSTKTEDTAPGGAPACWLTAGQCIYPEARILIVDDNEMNLEIAAAIMAPYQMHIDCALSGKEALAAIQEIDYDLVFMDHMMPDMDGVETLKNIRSLPGKKYRALPVIALTANATREAQDMFRAKGFSGFLPKPIQMELLDGLLSLFLKRV